MLRRKYLLEGEQMLAPDLALYEVANSIYKHEHVLGDLVDGASFLSIFQGLIEAGNVLLLSPNKNLMQKAYAVAGRNRVTVYDAVFIALALEMGLTLRTFDDAQARAMKEALRSASK